MKSTLNRAKSLRRFLGGMAIGGAALLALACQAKESADAPAPAPSPAKVASAAPAPPKTPEPEATPEIKQGPGIQFPVSRTAPSAAPIRGAVLDNPDLFLYAKIHSPARTFDRITSWITQLNTDTDSASVYQRMTSTGFDPAQFRPGADIVFFQWKPSQEGANPGWALQLPLNANSPMQLMLSFIAPGHTYFGSDVVFADSQDTADAIDAGPQDLQAVGKARMQSDFEFAVNVKAMYGYYGKKLREQILEMEQMIAGGDPANGEENFVGRTRAQQRMLKAQAEAMLALAEQVQSICFTITLDPDAAKLTFYLEPLPGSALAEVFDKRPVEMPDLTRYLGDGHTFLIQMNLGANKDLIADYVRYATTLLPPDKADIGEKMQEAVEKFIAAGVGSYAMAADIGTSKTMLGGSIVQADQPEGLIAFIRQNTQLLGVQTFGASSGIDFDVASHSDARKIEDFSVDHYDINFRFPPSIPEQQARIMKALWGKGEAQVETMPYGSAALLSMGMPIENLMQKVSQGKEAPVTAESPLFSRRIFPKGAIVYADVDVPQYIKAVTAAMDFIQPTNQIQSPPLAIAAYHQNGAGYYRAQLPIETFAAMEGLRPPPGFGGDRRGGPGGRGQGQGQGMRGGRGGRRVSIGLGGRNGGQNAPQGNNGGQQDQQQQQQQGNDGSQGNGANQN